MLASDRVALPAAAKIRLVGALARDSGLDGMVGRPDVRSGGRRRFEAAAAPLSLAAIRHLQSLKTGALIRFAAEAGGMMAVDAPETARQALTVYGDALGLAFLQIRDDLLDVEGDAALVGKAVAKDAAAGKGTFVSHLGIDGARAELDRVSEAGIAAVKAAFGAAAGPLEALIVFNRQRKH